MKLLVQSDDYGITKAQAAGAVHGIKNGIIRNTGLFVNMPWSTECVELIYPYLDKIAFGIDLNASTGSALLSHEIIPSLTHSDGSFLTSRENRALDTEENNYDHVVYNELYLEFDAQIRKYVEYCGKLPDYLHAHAYTTKTTHQVIKDLSQKYGKPYTFDYIAEKYNEKYVRMEWVKMGEPSLQIQSDPTGYLLSHKEELKKKEFVYLVTHCGYCDSELMSLSSFNLVRMKDLEAVTSPAVKAWIKENQIELVDFRGI